MSLNCCAAWATGVLALCLCRTVAAQERNLLPNGDFAVAEGTLARGWMLQKDVGEATGARRDRGGPEDAPYLEATVAAPGQCDFRASAGSVPVKAEAAYLATCWVRAGNVAGGSHSVELQWFGEKGFLSRDPAAATVAGKWVRIAVGPLAPPKDATSVYVLLRCYQAGTYAFAGVGLYEVTPLPRSVLRDPGFESDADGDGVPDGWQAVPGEGGAAWDSQVGHTGRYGARLQLPATAKAGAAWVQRDVRVTPSARYDLSAQVTSDKFGREVRLEIEWLRAERSLARAELKDQTSGQWQRKTLRAVAPPDADRATVTLQLLGEGTVGFDDVTLTEEGVIARVDLALEKPNARGLIRDGVDERVLRARCALDTAEKDVRLRLRLVARDGKCVIEERPRLERGRTTWALDLRALPRGAYTVQADAITLDGRVLASETANLDLVPPDAAGILFREDHVALVEGKPWFPIGVCSMPVVEPVAEKLAAAGFNLIVTGNFTREPKETVRAILERARSLGLYLIEWNNGYAYEKITSEERHKLVAESAAHVAGNPRFLGWMCDEALWNGVALAEVRDAYLAAREAAPTLVFWQNQAPRNTIEDLARYTRWCDVTGMDIYPVEGADHSDLPNKTLSVVGDEMGKQHRTVGGRKPVWAILQGFGWSVWEPDPKVHKRAPTWQETRFMAYDAILHGATGIIYWGASYEPQDSDIWNSLRRVARELADLTPVLVSPDKHDVSAEPATVRIAAQARRVQGKWWIIAANETGGPASVTLTGLPGQLQVERVGEEAQTLTVQAGRLVGTFAPWGVHVYRQR